MLMILFSWRRAITILTNNSKSSKKFYSKRSMTININKIKVMIMKFENINHYIFIYDNSSYKNFLHTNIWQSISIIYSIGIMSLKKGKMEVGKLTMGLKIVVSRYIFRIGIKIMSSFTLTTLIILYGCEV